MLFSATLPEHVEKLSEVYVNPAYRNRIPLTLTNQIEHSLFVVTEQQKFNLLRDVQLKIRIAVLFLSDEDD